MRSVATFSFQLLDDLMSNELKAGKDSVGRKDGGKGGRTSIPSKRSHSMEWYVPSWNGVKARNNKKTVSC